MDSSNAISPIDGRYSSETKVLAVYFSESALMRYRIIVEGEYLIALSELDIGIRKFTSAEKEIIRELYILPSEKIAIISDIELRGYKNIKATDHDVKAVEYFIKDQLGETSLKDVLEWVHFALTSEDINNIAYSLMLSEGLRDVILPNLEEVLSAIKMFAKSGMNIPMLARTHGQPASPTTFSKEMMVFVNRLERQIEQLKKTEILAKLNGATGNYNAHYVAFPKVDWLKFTEDFVAQINHIRNCRLGVNSITTQIEPHDSYAELFDALRRINIILIDFNQDIWRYISDNWLIQKNNDGEVGSSTMPHKINPIKFENSEGNLGLANALFNYFSVKLPISRLQRDLSDSTVLRNMGVAFAYSLLGYKYILKGLSRVAINEIKIREELQNHPEVIAEAIQTILRREGVAMPYEKLKNLTRGQKITMQDLSNFIDSLEISDTVKTELHKISPENYIGLSEKISGF